MKSQLKDNDAIKCKNLNEWCQILSTCMQRNFYIDTLGRFREGICLFMRSDDFITSGCENNNFILHSFEDFKAKILGIYIAPAYIHMKYTREVVKELIREIKYLYSEGSSILAIIARIESQYLGE